MADKSENSSPVVNTKNSSSPSSSNQGGSGSGEGQGGTWDTIKAAGKMIAEGTGKSYKQQFYDGPNKNYAGTGANAKRSIFGDSYDYEKRQEYQISKLDKIDQSMHPQRQNFHSATGMSVCTENALLQCAMGSMCSKLHIWDPTRKEVIGTGQKNRIAVITDCVPGVNLDGFGPCWNIINPAVLAATTAASIAAGTFVLTPMPCQATMMPSPWLPILPNILVGKRPILLQSSVSCCYGLGFITITHCGQGLDGSPIRFRDADGNVDWHLVASFSANILGSVVSGGAAGFVRAAKAAAAARTASAVSLAAKGAEGAAKVTELTTKSANLLKAANIAQKVSKAGDYGSNVVTFADGVGYMVQDNPDFTQGALNMGSAVLGSSFSAFGDIRARGRGTNGSQQLANAFRETIDPSMQPHFDKLLQNGGDPDFIKSVIKKNPEIYGDVSKLPDDELDKIIRNTKPFQNADDAERTARATSESAEQAVTQATKERNAVVAAPSTGDAADIAKVQAKASKKEADNAKQAAETLKNASQKADDATKAYKDALTKVDEIDRNIEEMSKQLSKLEPGSAEYRRLASQIETEKLKRFAANVDVQSCKTKLDEAASEFVDVKNSTKQQYGVDTVEDMDNVATEFKKTADADAATANSLEQQYNTFNEIAGRKTVAETEAALGEARQNASRAESALGNAVQQQQTQHNFADAAAVAEAEAKGTALDQAVSKAGNIYNAGAAVVKPTLNDIHSTKDEQVEAYKKNGGFGLTPEEQAMLDNLDG